MPRAFHRLVHLLRSIVRPHTVERELDEELRFHFDALVERRIAEGVPADEARRQAMHAFGPMARVRTECREAWGRRVLDELRRDVVFALRSLWRTPSFSVVAVLVLALGIGATTTIFGVFDAVLLRPLPYPDSDRLISLAVRYESGDLRLGHDRAVYDIVREAATTVDDVAATSGSSGINLQWNGGARYLRKVSVTASYFDALDATLHLGRAFEPEDELPGAPQRVVVSREVFERDLGGDPELLGTLVRLGGEPHELVGVVASSFVHTFPVDIWTALHTDDHRGGGYNLSVLGRLAPGVTRARADAELAALTDAYHERIGASPESVEHFTAIPLQESVAGDLRDDLQLLLAAVGMLLLIACVNTAALLLARATSREPELALRRSLGGSRGRLVRQLLTESLVLGLVGGGLGVGLAALGLRWKAVLSLVSPGRTLGATLWEPRLDLRVLSAALAVSLVSAIVFGLAPAWRTTARRASARHSSGRGTLRLHRFLVVLEVGLCVLLLVGAGLLLQSLRSLRAVDPGVDPDHVVTAQMSLAGDPEPEERVRRFVALLDELEASPGVTAAALTNGLPVERGLNVPIFIPGDEDSGDVTSVDWRYVTPGFFETMGIPVVRGRAFGAADGQEGSVVAVNEAFVERYFDGGEPLGRVLELYHRSDQEGMDRPREVVGVVGNVKGRGLDGPPLPTLYVPLAQVPAQLLAVTHGFFPMSWVVRSEPGVDASRLLRDRVRRLDPEIPFARVRPMREVIAETYGDRRQQTTLLGSFAALALAMAITGIYGLIGYTVSRRTQEIGIRVALGAGWRSTLLRVIGQAAALAGLGIALGLAATLLLRQLLEGFLFGIGASDPGTLAAAAGAVLVAAMLAGLAPALRAARIDPATVLREE